MSPRLTMADLDPSEPLNGEKPLNPKDYIVPKDNMDLFSHFPLVLQQGYNWGQVADLSQDPHYRYTIYEKF